MRGVLRCHFDGEPPAVSAGDAVETRTADGRWLTGTAMSEPRYDEDNALGGRCFLTVSILRPGMTHPVNWPAEDVRATTKEPRRG